MDDVQTLLLGALRAEGRVLIKLNVSEDRLEPVLAVVPSMKAPTVSPLSEGGFAIEAVVEKTGREQADPGAEGRRRHRHPRDAHLQDRALSGRSLRGRLPGAMFEAHPVTKERWTDLVELFDRPVVRTCFCMFYRKTGTGTGVGTAEPAGDEGTRGSGHRAGLIGYEDGVPVAWVSLGPREDYPKLRRSPVMKPVDDRPVWSIVCFFVDRSVRGKGLAGADAPGRGGLRALARCPTRGGISGGSRGADGHPDAMFFGAKSMYDRAGFREVARRKPNRPVVRRALRPGRPASLQRKGG